MKYISQIRAFYDAIELNPLPPGQVALWHALMDRANRLCWPEWFTVTNIKLESSCSLSRRGIYNSRNALKQAGFIDFKSNGTKATSYKILKIYREDSAATLQHSAQDSAQSINTLRYIAQDTSQVSSQDTSQVSSQVSATLNRPKTKDERLKTKGQGRGRKTPTTHFAPPSVEDVRLYCQRRKNSIDANKFVDFYESKGWMVGKNKMKDWQAAVRTWEKSDNSHAAPMGENPFRRMLEDEQNRNSEIVIDNQRLLSDVSKKLG